MFSQTQRSRGVTPAFRRDRGTRTASRPVAFALPHLRPGMEVLDLGCGPGTLTLGLARAVAPGTVTGVDRDTDHVAAATALAAERGVADVTFRAADALDLPFEDGRFDAAFGNDVLTHLAGDAVRGAAEVHRVLRSGGVFAAREADATAAVWGGRSAPMQRFDDLFATWQRAHGRDVGLGRHLPAILREAGFATTAVTVSAEAKGTPEAVRSHADIMLFLLDGPLGSFIREAALAEESEVERIRADIGAWPDRPDAFYAEIHVEVIARKG